MAPREKPPPPPAVTLRSGKEIQVLQSKDMLTSASVVTDSEFVSTNTVRSYQTPRGALSMESD